MNRGASLRVLRVGTKALLFTTVAGLVFAPASFAHPHPNEGRLDGQAASGRTQVSEAESLTGLDLSIALGGGLLLIGAGAATARLVPRRAESDAYRVDPYPAATIPLSAEPDIASATPTRRLVGIRLRRSEAGS